MFIRPKIIEINSSLCAQYAGIYTPEVGGPSQKIRLENNRLYYYAYGKDELCPISETRFITSAELIPDIDVELPGAGSRFLLDDDIFSCPLDRSLPRRLDDHKNLAYLIGIVTGARDA
ncbi:MAG: hypothetical protein JXE07_02995 [Candidatus Aminicenantes bacterium]|nr:hypothetical protein [Candidatus Aminicenantes bacterium]